MGTRTMKKASETSNLNAAPPSASADSAPIPGDGLAIRISARDLKVAILRVASIADRKSTMPMLAHVLLRADAKGLLLQATDLNVSMRTTVATAKVVRSGAIALPGKQLADAVKSLPEGDVTISQSGMVATLSTGSANVQIRGLNERDYPRFPTHDDTKHPWSSTDAPTFAGLIESVEHAVCQDETRFHLNGVLLECSDTAIRAVATDGHRLAKAETWREGATTLRMTKGVILPRKACGETAKLLRKQEDCEISVTDSHVWVRVGETTLACKTIDAQFPPYEQVIPKNHRSTVAVNVAALTAALDRATKSLGKCVDTRGVCLTLASGKLTVQASHPDTGETTETLDAECSIGGSCSKIGVNPKYLRDVLRSCDDDIAVLALSDVLDPMLVMTQDDSLMTDVRAPRFLGVVMPMRI